MWTCIASAHWLFWIQNITGDYQRKSIAILNYKTHSTDKTFTLNFSTVVNSGIAPYVKMTIRKDELIDADIGI